MIYYGNELYHYGVLGMRWGVRRSKNSSKVTKTTSKNKRQTSSKKKIKLQVTKSRNSYLSTKRFLETKFNEKSIEFARDMTAYASGALWIASAFIPGPTGVIANRAAALSQLATTVIDKY